MHVVIDQPRRGVPGVAESDEGDNLVSSDADITATPANLKVVAIQPPTDARSGELAEVSWTVRNDGADVWDGTEVWTDAVFISPDPVLDFSRAERLAVETIALPGGLSAGEEYTHVAQVRIPAGLEGAQFLHVITDTNGGSSAANEILSGSAKSAFNLYDGSVFEGAANDDNIGTAAFDVVFAEPNLVIDEVNLPETLAAGETVPISFTVRNAGGREADAPRWTDRVFLSRDEGLDNADFLLGEFEFEGPLAAGEDYVQSGEIVLPTGISGEFFFVFQTDSGVVRGSSFSTSDIAPGLRGVSGTSVNRVREFQNEGDNLAILARNVAAAPLPNLKVTEIVAPEEVIQGERLEISYTVKNDGAAT
ncbi:MAG: hypothetical protein D6744_15255, partial [Planctomycetota bacterium]